MDRLLVSEVLQNTGGIFLKGNAAFQFSRISIDTRTLQPGDVYVALKGARFDGHDFIAEAVKKGAIGIIGERIPAQLRDSQVAFLLEVQDSLPVLQKIAYGYRKKFTIPVVAITGSNGKTTTKELASSILSTMYRTFVTPGNFNNHIGLPLTLLQLEREHEVVVLELGTSSLGEIDALAKISEPTIGVITCIGQSHLEGLKSVKNVLAAKMELIDNLPAGGVAILNHDDLYLRKVTAELKRQVISFGVHNGATVLAKNSRVDYEKQSLSFVLNYAGEEVPVTVPIVGEHNVSNALAAACVGIALHVPLEKIVHGFRKFHPIAGRMRILHFRGAWILDDCYNANPDSVQAALVVLTKFSPAQRRIAVIGDMLELGKFSKQKHEEIGKMIGQAGIDMLYTIGLQADVVGRTARRYGLSLQKIRVFEPHAHELLALDLCGFVTKGDVVLVKGSHGLHLEKIVEKMES